MTNDFLALIYTHHPPLITVLLFKYGTRQEPYWSALRLTRQDETPRLATLATALGSLGLPRPAEAAWMTPAAVFDAEADAAVLWPTFAVELPGTRPVRLTPGLLDFEWFLLADALEQTLHPATRQMLLEITSTLHENEFPRTQRLPLPREA